jgi:YHS domain-containing protein
MKRDPVCGMQIDTKNPVARFIYQGKEYYFCSDQCKKLFIKQPEKYLSDHNESKQNPK